MKKQESLRQLNLWVSAEFRDFFRTLVATEQLQHTQRRITQKSLLEKAVLQYARRTHPDLIPKEL